MKHIASCSFGKDARMMELQAIPGKVSEKFNRTERFDHIDAAFRQEDAQESLFRQAA